MGPESLSGAEKAAVVLLSIPGADARSLLARMGDDEVERVMAAVSRIEAVTPELREQVMEELRAAIRADAGQVEGGRDRALALIDEALDDTRKERIRARLGQEVRRIDWTLQGFEPAFIADALESEHPQTLALILSQLPAESGAGILSALAPELQAEIVLRLADLDEVSFDVIGELERAVAASFGMRSGAASQVPGRDAAAQIINQVGKEGGDSILSALGGRDVDLATAIRKRMLTFNDLVSIDDREFQLLLREVATEDLVVALKTATAEMSEKVFKNVSSRAADQIREDLEMLGPMKLSEVEAVQERVVELAQRLAEEGTLNLPIGGSQDVLV